MIKTNDTLNTEIQKTPKKRLPWIEDPRYNKVVNLINDYRSEDASRSAAALEEIMEDYQKSITDLIKKHFPTYMEKHFEDLLQLGKLGFIESLKKYNPEKSSPILFSYSYILCEITTYISNLHGLNSHTSSQISKINKAEDKLKKRGIENPTPADIAIETGMSIDLVMKSIKLRNISQTKVFLDNEKIETELNEYEKSPEELYVENEHYSTLYRALNDILTPTERDVIILKFGLLTNKSIPNNKISAKLNISANSVRTICNKAISKLRNYPGFDTIFSDQYRRPIRKAKETIISIPPIKAVTEVMMEIIEDEDGVKEIML